MNKFKLGDKVNIISKNKTGKVAYIGETHFSDGEWIGIILDEAKGRNNGCIDGERYFECPENHGIFVRSSKLEKNNNQVEKGNVTKVNHSWNYGCNRPPAELKTVSKSMPVIKKSISQVDPMNNVLKELEIIIEKQSKEISDMKNQKSKDFENLKHMKNQLQKMANELKVQSAMIKDFKSKLISSQRVVEEFSRKFTDAEENLKISEKRRINLDETVQQLREITESVIIKKEIAEEKIDDLEIRLKDETEKCKSLEIEAEIAKEEMELQCINGARSIYPMEKLEHQNMILNKALQELSKLYKSLQKQHSECKKVIQKTSEEIKDLKEVENTRKLDISKCKEEVTELYEVLDSMVIADDLVYEVTDRNLMSDEEICRLNKLLRDTEDELEISEEMEEILQEMKSIYREDIESLELKIFRTKTALEQQISLQKNNEEVIAKYKELTAVLHERNFKLSSELETALKERNAAVVTAENLKLKIHKDERKSLRSMIQEESMKFDFESLKDELNYWSPFLPDNFFVKGRENSAIQVKLLLSKMIKKLDLIIKLLNVSYHKWDIIKCDEFENLAIEVRFVIFACQLKSVLKKYNKSFDYTDVENFLSLGTQHDTLARKSLEIDGYFAFLVENGEDRQNCLDRIRETLYSLSQLLKNMCAPKYLETMINFECHLNVISVSCSYALTFCSAVEKFDRIKSDLKSEVKQISGIMKTIKSHAQSIFTSLINFEKENLYLVPHVDDTLEAIWKLIKDVMDYLIIIYRNCFGSNREFYSADLENVSLNGIICNLKQTENDLEYLRKSINNGEFLAEQTIVGHNISPIFSWAETKKQEEEEAISNLKNKMSSNEMDIIRLSQTLHTIRKQKSKINHKALCSVSVQTENYDIKVDCAGDNNSSMTEYLKLKLNDMELSMKYLSQKNVMLMCEKIKNHQSFMAPLKILPRPKYNPEVHDLYILQKRLNKASAVLKSIIVPFVADITKRSACKLRKYKKYQFERFLTIKGVEEELWCINLEIKRLKKALPCARSKTNPFSLRNVVFEY